MVTTRETPTPSSTAGNRIGEGEYADQVAAHVLGLWSAAVLPVTGLSGTNDLTGSVTPPVDVYIPGMAFWIAPANDNTDVMTLDVGAGALSFLQQNGDPMAAGDIVGGETYLVLFTGTEFRVQNAGQGGSGGGGGGSSSVDVQQFTASGTWTKPATGTVCLIRCWGAGGSGGRAGSGDGGGGGGGGAYVDRIMNLSDLSATVAVTIGGGGAAQTADNNNGAAGGNTTFGSFVTAFGGGAGSGTGAQSGGGGGGGATSAASAATGSATGSNGGTPRSTIAYYKNGTDATVDALVQGTGGSLVATPASTLTNGYAGNRGGGGGGGGGLGVAGQLGGDSVMGGGGGGGGSEATGAQAVGGNSIYGGAGGGGGSSTTAAAAGGTSLFGGNGGAGAFAANAATAGAQPGGGGGGSCTGNSGAGGAGMCIVISW